MIFSGHGRTFRQSALAENALRISCHCRFIATSSLLDLQRCLFLALLDVERSLTREKLRFVPFWAPQKFGRFSRVTRANLLLSDSLRNKMPSRVNCMPLRLPTALQTRTIGRTWNDLPCHHAIQAWQRTYSLHLMYCRHLLLPATHLVDGWTLALLTWPSMELGLTLCVRTIFRPCSRRGILHTTASNASLTGMCLDSYILPALYLFEG